MKAAVEIVLTVLLVAAVVSAASALGVGGDYGQQMPWEQLDGWPQLVTPTGGATPIDPGGPPPGGDAYLQEDGSSYILQEDGSSYLLLE